MMKYSLPTSRRSSSGRMSRGFSLFEATMVLAITGMVFAAIWAAADSVSQKNTVNELKANVIKTAQNTRLLYQGRNGFNVSSNGMDITETLVAAGVFPSTVFAGSSTLVPTTPWGTHITVRVSPTIPGRQSKNFEVDLGEGLPYTICAHLIASMVGPGRDPSLVLISINGVKRRDVENAKLANMTQCSRVSFIFKL